MKAKDVLHCEGYSRWMPKIQGQGGLDLMQEELMEVNMEYMEQTNRVQLESIFHKGV